MKLSISKRSLVARCFRLVPVSGRQLPLTSIAAAMLLPGCVTVTQVKDVNADPEAFAARNFTLANINQALVTTLVAAGAPGPKNFKEVSFKFEHTYRRIGAKEDSVSQPRTSFRPLGNGLFQEFRDLENDGVPVARQFVVSYLGALTLKREIVPMQGRVTQQASEVKSIQPFKFLPPSYPAGSNMTMRYDVGAPPQVAFLQQAELACTVDKTVSASELHPKIKGHAVWLDCTLRANNTIANRSRVAYFPQYGVGVTMQVTSSELTTTEKIVDFIES